MHWAVSDRKWKLATEEPEIVFFFSNFLHDKYVFYICEQTGEKIHLTVSNISAECSTSEDGDGFLSLSF